jgi:hypothetical protein
MKTYTVTIACNVRAYACLEIKAKSKRDAQAQLDAVVTALDNDRPHPLADSLSFNPNYESMSEFEALEDDLREEK